MQRRAQPLRPAVVPAALFLLGSAVGRPPWTAFAGAIVAAGAALAAVSLRPSSSRFAFLALASLAAGAGLAVHDQDTRSARTHGWIPEDGSAVETSVEGTVLRSPETGYDGAAWITLRAAPPSWGSSQEPAVLRLRIEPVPADRAVEVLALRRGDRVRCWCRIHADSDEHPFDLSSRGLDAQGSVKSSRLVELRGSGGEGMLRRLDRARAWLRGRIGGAFADDPAARGVFAAMLLGDRSTLDPDGVRRLRDGGLLHLLSISGLHVALVLGLLLAALRRTPFRRSLVLFGIVGSALGALSFLVGADAPILRSAASAAGLLFGRALGRRGDSINTLALVAAALVAAAPAVVFHVGFQLSFAATAAILLWASPLARAIPLPRPMALSLGVSAAAYLGTAPIVASEFGRMAPAGLITNLLSAPLCAALLLLGAAAALTVSVPVLGPALAGLATACVRALFAICSWGAALPGGSQRVPPPSAALLALLCAALVAFASGTGRGPLAEGERGHGATRALRRVAVLATACGILVLHLGPPPPRGDRAATLVVFDVGQGQAVAWLGPRGDPVLVDTGPSAGGRFDAGERIVVPQIAALGHRRLGALVLTHDHDDHTGGAAAVLRELEVEEVWIPLGSLRDPNLRSLADIALARGAALRLASRGTVLDRAGSRLEFLHPTRVDLEAGENDRGLVVRLVAPGGAAAIVPGDLEEKGESRLLRSGLDLSAGVLVVGHHGAAASTSESFLAAIRPSIAVISAGRANRFGHPALETLRRLRGTIRLRTDRDGLLRFKAGPGGWEVEAMGRRDGWGGE